MLSLDEPLDLKLPRRPNGRDRGTRSPPLSPLHPKRARQLRMADDGTAVIEPASPASPHTGERPPEDYQGMFVLHLTARLKWSNVLENSFKFPLANVVCAVICFVGVAGYRSAEQILTEKSVIFTHKLFYCSFSGASCLLGFFSKHNVSM